MIVVPDYKILSLTEFRAQASFNIKWMNHMGRHLWISKHGRHVAGVIPIDHLRILERMLGWDNQAFMHDQEIRYKRWRAAKAQQAWEEANASARARLKEMEAEASRKRKGE